MSNILVRQPSRRLPKRREHIADATMTISSAGWNVAAESVILPPVRDLKDGFKIRRAMPSAQRRMVGPFIFLHHFEPIMFRAGAGPNVGPHPHIALSTVSCLPEGAMIHRDSAGNLETIYAGGANWMTGSRGIVSSERPPAKVQAQGGSMFGQQISVALPTALEEKQPGLSHHAESSLLGLEAHGVSLTVVAGEAFGERSPVPVHSDLMYVDVVLKAVARLLVRPNTSSATRSWSQARSKSRARPGRFAKPSSWSSNLARRSCRPREVAPMSCWSAASLSPSLGTSTGISCRARRTASSRPRTIGGTVAFPTSPAKRSSSRCCLTGCAIPLIFFA
jgi:redox-sensitive bicupin YhaK (pirin superfamily)